MRDYTSTISLLIFISWNNKNWDAPGTVRFHLGNIESAKKDLFKAFGLYEARGNMIYCAFTRSLIMELFRDPEVYKDLFGVESGIVKSKK